MRRCKDDWVNATQILKLCNFPKAKRTKILEKGVQQRLHEKVQGGYGRFQGTWIPLQDARNLAKEYNISPEMVPVLYIDLNDPSIIIPKKSKITASNKDGTPVKRKYVRKIKKDEETPKKMKFDDNLPPQAMFTQDYVPPMSKSNQHQMAPSDPRVLSQYNMPMQMQQMPQYHQQEFVQNGMISHPLNYDRSSFPKFSMADTNGGPAHLQSAAFNKQSIHGQAPTHQQVMYHQSRNGALSLSTNETNWSHEDITRDSDTSMSSNEVKMMHNNINEEMSHVSQIIRYFSEDNGQIPYFLYNPPPEFNLDEAIDDEGHSTLHWAASVGNAQLVQLLLSKGANSLVISNYGLNPLSKCVSFNNCHDMRNFHHILDLLETCLINTDVNGRTPLHYICQFSRVKSKLPALSYYVDLIFNKLKVMSNNTKGNGVDLMRNVIDHQDAKAETCLHLAVKAQCPQLIKVLLNYGARDDIPNMSNQTAKSLMVQLDLVSYGFETRVDDLNESNRQSEFQFSFGHKATKPRTQVKSEMGQNLSGIGEERLSENSAGMRTLGNGLGTPTRGHNKTAETPDTQRTTVQDEEMEEPHDRVSKEHLKSLLEKQAGLVDDNKENIFIDDGSKHNFETMSTPKHAHEPLGHKPNVLSVISEKANSSDILSPNKDFFPNPPHMNNNGNLVEEEARRPTVEAVKLPIKDVSSMMKGMMNSLSDSYEQEIKELNLEFKRVKQTLQEKKHQNQSGWKKVQLLLESQGYRSFNSLHEAAAEVQTQVSDWEHSLKSKETQLLCSIEKEQAIELAGKVQENESKIEALLDETGHASVKLSMSVNLSKLQLERNKLVASIALSVRNYAINNKMNKYRRLISLSCSLRVEDIDGLIDGIEESLMEGNL